MNSRLSGLAISLLAIALAGCSVLPDSRKIEYKSAGKVPSLDIPPDLSQITRDDRYVVPDAAGKGSATFSAYSTRSDAASTGAKLRGFAAGGQGKG